MSRRVVVTGMGAITPIGLSVGHVGDRKRHKQRLYSARSFLHQSRMGTLHRLQGTRAGGPIGIGGFSALTALSTSADPTRCSIPFDKERNGFVMGEGAGTSLVWERSIACREPVPEPTATPTR